MIKVSRSAFYEFINSQKDSEFIDMLNPLIAKDPQCDHCLLGGFFASKGLKYGSCIEERGNVESNGCILGLIYDWNECDLEFVNYCIEEDIKTYKQAKEIANSFKLL